MLHVVSYASQIKWETDDINVNDVVTSSELEDTSNHAAPQSPRNSVDDDDETVPARHHCRCKDPSSAIDQLRVTRPTTAIACQVLCFLPVQSQYDFVGTVAGTVTL